MLTPVLALTLLLVALVAPAAAQQVCEPCQNDIDILVEVPVRIRTTPAPRSTRETFLIPPARRTASIFSSTARSSPW